MRLAAILLLSIIASYAVGLWIGSPWLLPLLNCAPAYALMVKLLRRGDRMRAIVMMIIWALMLGTAATIFFSLWPADPADSVLRGAAYRDEMFQWIRTGEGPEGNIRLFLPQHLLHLALFIPLSLATAGSLSMCFGAVLMNYMAYYVASLARSGVPAWAVALLGWQPWALCRICAFCILGVVLAEPPLRRLWGKPPVDIRSWRTPLIWVTCLLVADVLLKNLLAPMWGNWLCSLLTA